MNVCCAITAGGKAKRLNGVTKAFIEFGGQKIIDKNLTVLKKIFEDIIIISNDKSEFSDYQEYKIFKDHYIGIGPIAGLHSALKNSKADTIFLISSDLPFISKEIIFLLLENYKNQYCDILIPKVGNKIEPLFGIYSKNIIEKLESFIENKENYAMRNFFNEVNTRFMELADNEATKRAFININTPKDLE